jgi:hypothetical protein
MVGGAKRRRGLSLRAVALVVPVAAGLMFAAWLFGGAYLKERDAALARAGEWAIEGPSCRRLTRAQFEAERLKAPRASLYQDVVFRRQFGHVSCGALRYGAGWSPSVYPSCQFTSPRALTVTTSKGEWRFVIPPGQPATVAVPRGVPRCVLAANFTIKNMVRRGLE